MRAAFFAAVFFNHVHKLPSDAAHETCGIRVQRLRERHQEIVRLKGEIARIADVRKRRRERGKVELAGEGQHVIVAVQIVVVHMQRLQPLFAERSDKIRQILIGQPRVPDVKAGDHKRAVHRVEIGTEFLGTGAGAVDDAPRRLVILPHILARHLDAELFTIRHKRAVKLHIHVKQRFLAGRIRQMLLRVHNDGLCPEHCRRLDAAHDGVKTTLVVTLVARAGCKRCVRLVAHDAARIRRLAKRADIVPPVVAVHRIVLVAEHRKKAHVEGIKARRLDHADGFLVTIDPAEKIRLRG